MQDIITENSLVRVKLFTTDDTDLVNFMEERNNPLVRITEVETEKDGEETGMYWGEVADTKEPIPYALYYYDLYIPLKLK